MGLVILASSPYSSEFLVPGGGWSASGVCYVFVCVGPAHLVFLWEREQECEMYIWVNFVVCASVFTYLR